MMVHRFPKLYTPYKKDPWKFYRITKKKKRKEKPTPNPKQNNNKKELQQNLKKRNPKEHRIPKIKQNDMCGYEEGGSAKLGVSRKTEEEDMLNIS